MIKNSDWRLDTNGFFVNSQNSWKFEMIIQGFEIYYAAACLIMVCSSLFCAMVRYFHMCRPFDEHEEYFYPARKLITFVYVCFAIPAVWLFRMDSPDAWLFVQVFLVLFLPGAAVITFRRFFLL